MDARVYKNVTTVRLNATRHTMSSSTNVRSLQACAERVGIQMTIYTPCYYDERNETFALSKSVWKSVRSCKSFFYIFATGTRTFMHSLHEQKLFERHTETRRTFQSTAKSRREINFPFPRRRIYICDLKGSSIKSIYIYIYINDQRQQSTIRNRRLFKCSCHCRKLP